jgi:Icc protein
MTGWRLLHLSDTHAGATAHGDPLARLERVLAAVAADGFVPDLIVLSGDIADAGADVDVQAVLTRLAGSAPVLAVPGNHDDPATVPGPRELRLGPWRVLGLDTTIPDEIAGQIDEVPGIDGPTVLVMHHPLRSRSKHPWFVTRGADVAVAVLAAAVHPVIVLSGHTHEAYQGETGSLRVWGAPACYYAITHAGDSWTDGGATGVRLVELADDGTATTRVLTA